MKLSEMTESEKKVLGTLVRVMVGADGRISPAEYEGLQDAAKELGADEFWEVINQAGSHSIAEEEARAEAGAVDRKEAQTAIYGVLFGIAAAGTIAVQESSLLEWVADTWGLERAALG
ncbi:MAG: hypothetical protein V3T72_07910 [Thermoanaerobaculia bacterium]